ncbi:MAG: HEPN domain-containing protein [Candidatus Thorarchaeota archaeon]
MDDARMNDARGFYWCAKEDLKASQLLLDAEQYALSVFHVQQACEKLLKCLGLCSNLYLDSEQCKSEMGHDPVRFQRTYITKSFEKILPPDLAKELGRRLNETHKGGLEGTKSSSLRISQDKISEMMKQIRKMDEFYTETLNRIPQMKGLDEKGELRLENLLRFNYIYTSLTMLASMMKFHEITSRYPDNSLNPWDYDKDLGIVHALPELIQQLSQIIAFMRESYHLLNSPELDSS